MTTKFGRLLFFLSLEFCVSTLLFGQENLSPEFTAERTAAEKASQDTRSMAPLLKLLDRYNRPDEIADLEMTIGMFYGQRTGLVNPSRSVLHLTNALKYELPERARLQALLWRGDAHLQLRENAEAARDYLRVLLGISTHDLSSGSQEILGPSVPILNISGDPENEQRRQDYEQYRRQLDMDRFLLFARYGAIENLKEAQRRAAISDGALRAILKELNPDVRRGEVVMQWLREENKRP